MTTSGSTPDGADLPIDGRPASGPELTDADRIRAAVLDCPDVAALSAGPLGEVASSLPGRSVSGVRVDTEHVEVHVVATYRRPLRAVAEQIGDSVRNLLDGRPLRVYVDDILLPGETLDPVEQDTPDTSGAG